jgi:hypothetical protein
MNNGKTMKSLTFLFNVLALEGLLALTSCATSECCKCQAGGAAARRDVLYVCSCGPDCKCTSVGTKPGKCGCGKPLRKVNLKGTGLYFCNCGGSCTCNTVLDQPGQCKCGMALKRAD